MSNTRSAIVKVATIDPRDGLGLSRAARYDSRRWPRAGGGPPALGAGGGRRRAMPTRGRAGLTRPYRNWRLTTSPPERPMGFLRLLRQRHLALLWVGQVCSAIGDYLYQIAVVWTAVQVAGRAGGVGDRGGDGGAVRLRPRRRRLRRGPLGPPTRDDRSPTSRGRRSSSSRSRSSAPGDCNSGTSPSSPS